MEALRLLGKKKVKPLLVAMGYPEGSITVIMQPQK